MEVLEILALDVLELDVDMLDLEVLEVLVLLEGVLIRLFSVLDVGVLEILVLDVLVLNVDIVPQNKSVDFRHRCILRRLSMRYTGVGPAEDPHGVVGEGQMMSTRRC